VAVDEIEHESIPDSFFRYCSEEGFGLRRGQVFDRPLGATSVLRLAILTLFHIRMISSASVYKPIGQTTAPPGRRVTKARHQACAFSLLRSGFLALVVFVLFVGAALGTLEAQTSGSIRNQGEVGHEERLIPVGFHPFMEVPPPIQHNEVDWSKVRPAFQKDGVERPFAYYLPVAASGSGANESLWKTVIHGRNAAGVTADIILRLTPRGRPMRENDPVTDPQYVDGRHAIRWDDPLATLFGASGSGWLLVESTEKLDFSTSYTFNQAADGTEQGQGIPVFDSQSIMQHLAHAGDVISFELYGTPWGEEPVKRENLLYCVPHESGGVRLHYTVIGEDGGEQASGDFSCEPGTYQQPTISAAVSASKCALAASSATACKALTANQRLPSMLQ
jgi:hypothetical protein